VKSFAVALVGSTLHRAPPDIKIFFPHSLVRSYTVTRAPARAAKYAAVSPAAPPPRTATREASSASRANARDAPGRRRDGDARDGARRTARAIARESDARIVVVERAGVKSRAGATRMSKSAAVVTKRSLCNSWCGAPRRERRRCVGSVLEDARGKGRTVVDIATDALARRRLVGARRVADVVQRRGDLRRLLRRRELDVG